MNRLKMHVPEEMVSESLEAEDGGIIPFERFAEYSARRRQADPLSRAKLMHRNKVCPDCRRAAVEPIELNDKLQGRSHLPIPGTGTLLGFRCRWCRHEWSAESSQAGHLKSEVRSG